MTQDDKVAVLRQWAESLERFKDRKLRPRRISVGGGRDALSVAIRPIREDVELLVSEDNVLRLILRLRNQGHEVCAQEIKSGYKALMATVNADAQWETKYKSGGPTKGMPLYFEPLPVQDEAGRFAKTLLRVADELETTPKRNEKNSKPLKPPQEAIQAYVVYNRLGGTQQDTANHMNKVLKPDKPFTQCWVSRAIKKCEAWLKANGLKAFPEETKFDIMTMDPHTLEKGARTDGRVTGDPRHTKTMDPDDLFE